MSTDTFTKPVPDANSSVWQSNLYLINIVDSAQAKAIDYHPDMVKSLRGDLDKPVQTQLISEAVLSDEEVPQMVCARGLAKTCLVCSKWSTSSGVRGPSDVCMPCALDDNSTVCPSEDAPNFDDLEDWDNNEEWTEDMADSYQDFPLPVSSFAEATSSSTSSSIKMR